MPKSKSVITFPSASKFYREYLDYAYKNSKGFAIDDNYLKCFNLQEKDKTTSRNKLQMLEFMGLIENKSNIFIITENGKRLVESKYDNLEFMKILYQIKLPYTESARYLLSNKEYHIFEIFFDLFYLFYYYNLEINSADFEYVFTILINDNNYNNINELFRLLIENYKISIDDPKIDKARATIDYLFSSLEEINVFKKKDNGFYMVTDFFFDNYKLIKDRDYSDEELAEILDDYYDKYKDHGIRYFGIKYSKFIQNASKIKQLSKKLVGSCYDTEINKGKHLAELVTPNDELLPINRKIINDNLLKSNDTHLLGGKNLIVYGIPGCGKSYYVQNTLLKDVEDDFYVRTTFHPEYTNSDFIGQLVPFKEDEQIGYKYIKGPFTEALYKALTNPDKMVYLVIEEINRGNAPAIFGDIFQLLDRDETGKSEYPIFNVNIQNQLKDNGIDLNKIYIPSNLTIIGTMNTSDQNVFTLDTAFKRRWELELVENNLDDNPYCNLYVPGYKITWKEFVTTINEKIEKITKEHDLSDKRIGSFFVKESDLSNKEEDHDEAKIKRFSHKVIEYLWNDVLKFIDKSEIFDSSYGNYESLLKGIKEYKNVFNVDFPENLTSELDDEEEN